MFNNAHVLRNTVRGAWLLASLAGITLIAPTAQAGSPATPSISVVYSQKDLASSQGVQALYSRLQSAARHVCPDTDVRDLRRAGPAWSCYESALARAVAGIRKPELAALHAQGKARHSTG